MTTSHPALGGIDFVFGGNVFGWTLDRDRSFAMLDAFYEAGGRMIDSADCYSSWVPGNKGGESETIIGEWMELRGVRGEMLIATKTGMGGAPGLLRPEVVETALAASLERLRTDYVDLYYAHRDDPETPLDEVVSVYAGLMASGKARELGGSNYEPPRLAAALDTAGRLGVAGFTVFQPKYNLGWRHEFEGPLQQLCAERGLAVLPYYGLGSGFLTGKFRQAADWEGSSRSFALGEFADNGGWQVLEAMDKVAARTGATLSQIALAWLSTRRTVAAPLASATTPAQLAELLAAASLRLDSESLDLLDACLPQVAD